MLTQLIALAVVFITVYLLVKQYETRIVLIGAGIILCLLTLSPMDAFDAFTKRMSNSALIEAICSSMGFAFVMKYTKCDAHLVQALTKTLTKMGFFLIPAAVMITYLINIAIPSAAGCAAAVGATLIPLLIAARIHPAIAGGTVLCGTIGSMISPGLSHNSFVAQMSNMSIIDLIARHSTYSIMTGVIAAVSLGLVAFVRKEYSLSEANMAAATTNTNALENTPQHFNTNYLYASAPFIPLILLLLPNFFPAIKIGVPTAMLVGCIYALIITRCNPGELSNQFFKGMGTAYGDILGIIIAAAVFAEGLKASGLIAGFIEILTHSPDIARWGGTLGPFLMGVITGSGDAAAFAFNETVTPHAAALGFEIPDLGMAAAISGALGRTMSPLAGAAIVCAGLAGVNPLELVKRTAPGMLIAVCAVAIFML